MKAYISISGDEYEVKPPYGKKALVKSILQAYDFCRNNGFVPVCVC